MVYSKVVYAYLGPFRIGGVGQIFRTLFKGVTSFTELTFTTVTLWFFLNLIHLGIKHGLLN